MKHILILLALVFSMAGVNAQTTSTETQTTNAETQATNAEQDFQTSLDYYEEEDYEQAFIWVKKAAEQGHAKAQHGLGHMYEYGQGVERNYTQAFDWQAKAAKQSNTVNQHTASAEQDYQTGLEYYSVGSYKKARAWFDKAAIQDHANAQYDLGMMYKYRQGAEPVAFCIICVRADTAFEESQRLFRKAAKQGHAGAQYRLAAKRFYVNARRQVRWYKKAAIQGHRGSQSKLAEMYEDGDGVDENLEQAFYWNTRHAKQGFPISQRRVAEMYEDGDGVDENLEEAAYWYEEASKQGYEKRGWFVRRVLN